MIIRSWYAAAAAVVLLCAAPLSAQTATADEAAVRQAITDFNTAYRAMNAKAVAALFTPQVDIIDRFGHWVRSENPARTEELWHLTFTQIYKGKPGPERKVESVRMIGSDAALVQATTQWDAVKLDDGRVIPPHGEIDTFLLVRRDGKWQIAALNIHNQMAPGSERAGEKVPTSKQP